MHRSRVALDVAPSSREPFGIIGNAKELGATGATRKWPDLALDHQKLLINFR